MKYSEQIKKIAHQAAPLLAVFCAGWIACSLFFEQPVLPNQNREVREKNTTAVFTSPLLECTDYDFISNKTINELKQEVSSLLLEKEKQPEVEKIAVYFRDLNNGPWFGIGEREEFIPGSLLKVPLMISALHEAMENPSVLDREVEVGPEDGYQQEISPSNKVQPGKKYRISQLIESMIRFSDNNAADALFRALKAERLEQSYTDLGILAPKDNKYTVSVRTYASFFRILYNATYISQFYSEKALYLLANTEFNDGIVAGVPSSVIVAHKFGEREDEITKLKQLHDCGIVYLPNRPYILCVMSKGTDFKKLEDVAADISRVIYRKLR